MPRAQWRHGAPPHAVSARSSSAATDDAGRGGIGGASSSPRDASPAVVVVWGALENAGKWQMSVEQNKETFRRWIAEGWNQGNLAVVDELYAPNYVSHSFPPTIPPNREGLKQFVTSFRDAFPDLQWTLHDVVGEGETVIARFTGAATHRGEFMGIPATDKSFSVEGFLQARFADGKWVEDWVSWDQLGMLQQLGGVPTPGG